MQSASDAENSRTGLQGKFAPIVLNKSASSNLVFCCDHAGSEIPEYLGDLGVSEEDRNDHIGLDIGIFATTCWVAGALDAPVVAQPVSRLVVDCNRRPESNDSIREAYDGRMIPGNSNLGVEEKERRVAEILLPYQNAIATTLATAKRSSTSNPVLVAMHSFSRSYGGKRRDCDIGVIFEGPQEFATALLSNVKTETSLNVRHNEPYRVDFAGDYTIPQHTLSSKIPYVEFEICQDLIDTCKGQRDVARILIAAFNRTIASCSFIRDGSPMVASGTT